VPTRTWREFRTAIVAVYRRIGDTAFERSGLKGDLREQLVSWFSAYVAYLIASGDFTGRYDMSRATAICSSALEDTDAEVQQELRFDVDHADLLRSDEVAAAVCDLLG
jgi:hypothetical protein